MSSIKQLPPTIETLAGRAKTAGFIFNPTTGVFSLFNQSQGNSSFSAVIS